MTLPTSHGNPSVKACVQKTKKRPSPRACPLASQSETQAARLLSRYQTYDHALPLWLKTPGGGDSHMKQTGMLVGNFELTPKGDHLGVAQGFCDP